MPTAAGEERPRYGYFYKSRRLSGTGLYRIAMAPNCRALSLGEAQSALEAELRRRMPMLAATASSKRRAYLKEMTDLRRFCEATGSESAHVEMNWIRSRVAELNSFLGAFDAGRRVDRRIITDPNRLAGLYVRAQSIGIASSLYIESVE